MKVKLQYFTGRKKIQCALTAWIAECDEHIKDETPDDKAAAIIYCDAGMG